MLRRLLWLLQLSSKKWITFGKYCPYQCTLFRTWYRLTHQPISIRCRISGKFVNVNRKVWCENKIIFLLFVRLTMKPVFKMNIRYFENTSRKSNLLFVRFVFMVFGSISKLHTKIITQILEVYSSLILVFIISLENSFLSTIFIGNL